MPSEVTYRVWNVTSGVRSGTRGFTRDWSTEDGWRASRRVVWFGGREGRRLKTNLRSSSEGEVPEIEREGV